ncbi:tubulin alpha, partial [Paragonimus westermani]
PTVQLAVTALIPVFFWRMGREILLLHFGQAGVQIGSALWELFCMEHRVSADGHLITNGPESQLSSSEYVSTFFYEGMRTWTPRAIMVDLEPTVIDEIRAGTYRKLWKPNCLITGKEDAANNYGRGNYTIGKQKMGETMETIRRLVEDSNNLAAFELVHSHSGGTGSGMTSLIIDQLCDEYGKKFKFSTSIFPSAMYSQSTVDPYNSILHSHATIETLDCDILVDNQTLFERCTRNLNMQQPSFTEINRLLAQMLSSVFMSHRFVYHGSQHADTTELLTNLIPYPRIHFPSLFYAPLFSHCQMDHNALSVSELTRTVFSEDAQTIDFPCKRNAYISCAMLYRGLSSPRQIYDALKLVKGTPSIGATFVDWCPTGFKVGLNMFPPITFPNSPLADTPRSICMLAGNLGMRHAWHRNNSKFDILFSRRSFVHWYISEGVEESEFVEARDDMAYLEQDYVELMSESIQDMDMLVAPTQATTHTAAVPTTMLTNKRSHASSLAQTSLHYQQQQQMSQEQQRLQPQQIGADSVHSRISSHPTQAVDYESRQTPQSNNANTIHNERNFHNNRRQYSKKFGQSDVIDWISSSERPETVSRSSIAQSTAQRHGMQVPRHHYHRKPQNRFAIQHGEAGDDWSVPHLESDALFYRGAHVTDREKNVSDETSESLSEAAEENCRFHRPYGDINDRDMPVSGAFASNESGPRSTDLSRASVPGGFNTNNARHSQASSNTTFLPTEPLVRHSGAEFTSTNGGAECMLLSRTSNIQALYSSLHPNRKEKQCRPQINDEIKSNHDEHISGEPHSTSHWSMASPVSYAGREQSLRSEVRPRLSESEPANKSSDSSCMVECFDNVVLGTGGQGILQAVSVTSGLGSMSNLASSAGSLHFGTKVKQRVALEYQTKLIAPYTHSGSDGRSPCGSIDCLQSHHLHYDGYRHHHHHHHQHSHHHRHRRRAHLQSIAFHPDQLSNLKRNNRSVIVPLDDTESNIKHLDSQEAGDRHSITPIKSKYDLNGPFSAVSKNPVYEVSITEVDDAQRVITPIMSTLSAGGKQLSTDSMAT